MLRGLFSFMLDCYQKVRRKWRFPTYSPFRLFAGNSLDAISLLGFVLFFFFLFSAVAPVFRSSKRKKKTLKQNKFAHAHTQTQVLRQLFVLGCQQLFFSVLVGLFKSIMYMLQRK